MLHEFNEIRIHGVAGLAHEINRAYCESIGDFSQPKWEDAPQWQKDSAVDGVRFHIAHPNATASASHENWLKMKLADGWKYGAVKNADTKEHPCCVPFDELPEKQKTKDYLFRAVVHSLI